MDALPPGALGRVLLPLPGAAGVPRPRLCLGCHPASSGFSVSRLSPPFFRGHTKAPRAHPTDPQTGRHVQVPGSGPATLGQTSQKGQGFGPSSRVTSRRRNTGGGGFPPSAPRAGLAHRVTVLSAVPSLTPQKNTASAQSGHTKLLNARPAGRLGGRRASPGSHFCVTFLPWSSRPTFPAPFGVMCHSPANVGDPFVW